VFCTGVPRGRGLGPANQYAAWSGERSVRGAIIGATVIIAGERGVERRATTDKEGVYRLTGLAPGDYIVRASAAGFALAEQPRIRLAAGERRKLELRLQVAMTEEKVTVADGTAISADPQNNAGAIVLRGADLDALPQDPDDLAEALQALAGPAAGPNGGQIFVDGFTGGRIPPRDSIREIRINQNPFSAEYDRLGFGRIEILTRPGTDRLRGQTYFSFNDEALNARNAFAANRAPFQSRFYGGNLSGPLISKRASFFFDFERREEDGNEIINATILNQRLAPAPLALAVLAPQRRTTFSPRFDYALNRNHTLVGRYGFARATRRNAGIGDFNLLSRAFDRANTEHNFQLSETAILNARAINETRFQFTRARAEQSGDNDVPTIRVLDAFTGGGAQIGLAFNRENRWELSNHTSLAHGSHTLKFGARVRGVRLEDFSPNNFGGALTFAGGLAPQLDGGDQVIRDAGGNPMLAPITSLERYRRTLLFQRQGLAGAQIRALGGGATQLQITGGEPEARVSQWDFGGFAQDDWRVRPNFTLSAGLRYENQSNISSHLNFAPRVAFAWSPGGGQGPARAVIRGGFGVFYDRFGENLALQTIRFDGARQQQFLVTDPAILDQIGFTLDGVSNLPAIAQLAAFSQPQITRIIAGDLQAPYTMQSSLSVERQLPHNLTAFATFINTRTRRLLRSRNVNAPLPGTFVPGERGTGARPLPGGDIYQYESSGRLDQNQLILGLRTPFGRKYSLWAHYSLGQVMSDTDGAFTFPAEPYDLSREYGRASFDARRRLLLSGSYTAPWGVRLNTFVIASSNRPFNIIIGRDLNNDGLFTERPAFAADRNDPDVVVTPFGAFDLTPSPGQPVIPRNYGRGPAFFTTWLGVSKTFSLGRERNQGSGGYGGGFDKSGGGGGFDKSGGGGEKFDDRGKFGGGDGGRYNLTFSINAQNLFNRTNKGTPIGNLSSPLFGRANATAGSFGFGAGGGGKPAGNRRMDVQIRLTF